MSSLPLLPVERSAALYGLSGLSFSDQVVAGWDVLLARYRWDWFATFTFPDEVHPEAADKRYRVWMSKLQQAVTGSKHWDRHPADTVRWARGLEWQKRGVIHYHALMYQRRNLDLLERRKHWEAVWLDISGGFCSIFPCDSANAVRSYVAKYCGKGGQVDCSRDLPTVARGDTGIHC
jgi:hypothetical protein